MSNAPTRRRSLATADTKKAPTAELVSLAAQVMQANTEANAAVLRYNKLRAKLLTDMRDASFRTFDATALVDGKTISFEAAITASQRPVIDVEKLRKLVTNEVFMAAVSASKKSVEDAAGAAVATQVTVIVTGDENVSVKPRKA